MSRSIYLVQVTKTPSGMFFANVHMYPRTSMIEVSGLNMYNIVSFRVCESDDAANDLADKLNKDFKRRGLQR